MKLARMAEILEAEVICGHEKLDIDIRMAVASDMMSDVLANTDGGQVLISGLCTVHTVVTAYIGFGCHHICTGQNAHGRDDRIGCAGWYRPFAHVLHHVYRLWRAV